MPYFVYELADRSRTFTLVRRRPLSAAELAPALPRYVAVFATLEQALEFCRDLGGPPQISIAPSR